MKKMILLGFVLLIASVVFVARPDDCATTYISSYTEYQNPTVRKVWDELIQKYGEPCQLRRAARVNECRQTVTLSADPPVYLCWYGDNAPQAQPPAKTVQARDLDSIFRQIKKIPLDTINNQIPSFVRDIFGTNVIQLYIHHDSETDHFWVKTNDGQVTATGRGRILYPKPTLQVEASQETLDSLFQSQNPRGTLQDAISSGAVKIADPRAISKQGLVIKAGIAGVKLGLVPGGESAVSTTQPSIFDLSGKRTACNQKWELLKEPIGCNGPFQEFGYGKNCCEKECGADARCDEEAAGAVSGGSCTAQCTFTSSPPPMPPLTVNWAQPLRVVQPTSSTPGTIRVGEPGKAASSIGEFPGYKVCEFDQARKKYVTCTLPNLPQLFCMQVMTAPTAVALACDDAGMVICGLPCQGSRGGSYVPNIQFCAFDQSRERGANAEPLDFCE